MLLLVFRTFLLLAIARSFPERLVSRVYENKLFNSPRGMAYEITKLGDLLLAGLLTNEEFIAAKIDLLGPKEGSNTMQSTTPKAFVTDVEKKGCVDMDVDVQNGDFVRLDRRNNKGFSSLQVMPGYAGEKFYGLNDQDTPILKRELDDFLIFMTESNMNSQEPPIRMSTANVYVRHAKLFLGWVLTSYRENLSISTQLISHNSTSATAPENILFENLSINHIFPTTGKESASIIFEFLKWLRTNRKISSSYESNMLRGLIKLAKFRYSGDSNFDASYGGKPFDDIQMVRELRKLHRDATKLSSKTPRVAEEALKWISWNEYIRVVQSTKEDLDSLMKLFCTFAGCNVSIIGEWHMNSEELRRMMMAIDPELDVQDIWLMTDAEIKTRFREYKNLSIAASMNADDFVKLKELLIEIENGNGNPIHDRF